VGWSDKFYHWDDFVIGSDFIDKNKGAYLFVGESKKNDIDIILNRIGLVYPKYNVSTKVVVQNKKLHEALYEIVLTRK
jgi:hypothetical protein